MHVFGTNATDLVHIGQAIMGCGGTVDYLVDTVLNYPTLSEAYKVAALDVSNKIRAVEAFEHRQITLGVPPSGRTAPTAPPPGRATTPRPSRPTGRNRPQATEGRPGPRQV